MSILKSSTSLFHTFTHLAFSTFYDFFAFSFSYYKLWKKIKTNVWYPSIRSNSSLTGMIIYVIYSRSDYMYPPRRDYKESILGEKNWHASHTTWTRVASHIRSLSHLGICDLSLPFVSWTSFFLLSRNRSIQFSREELWDQNYLKSVGTLWWKWIRRRRPGFCFAIIDFCFWRRNYLK